MSKDEFIMVKYRTYALPKETGTSNGFCFKLQFFVHIRLLPGMANIYIHIYNTNVLTKQCIFIHFILFNFYNNHVSHVVWHFKSHLHIRPLRLGKKMSYSVTYSQ